MEVQLFSVDLDKAKEVGLNINFHSKWYSVPGISGGSDMFMQIMSVVENSVNYPYLRICLIATSDFDIWEEGDIIAILPYPNDNAYLIESIALSIIKDYE